MSHNKKDFLEALERSLGVVTTASKACNISRRTHYRWLDEDEEYAKSVKEIKDIALDFAESQLHKQIGEGNTTATIYFLKTQGKDRGYIEKQQIEVNKPKPFKWFDDE
jgi:hypothetical protein